MDGVHRVEAKAVEVEVAQPPPRVPGHEVADPVAARAVEVDGRPPGGPVRVGEVGAELAEVVAGRAQVVVDGVEDHREAAPVAGVDQPAQPFGAAIGGADGVEVHPVVAPPPPAGELGDRHQLDGVHPQVGEVVEAPDHAVEGPLGAEGAHVQLVDDRLPKGRRRPACVGPRELLVDQLRGALDPVGLVGGAGVGQPGPAVEAHPVAQARHQARALEPEAAVLPTLHGEALAVLQHQLRAPGPRGPDRPAHQSRSSSATGNPSRSSER